MWQFKLKTINKIEFSNNYFVNDDACAMHWHDVMMCSHFAADVVVLFVRPNCGVHD